MTIWAGVDVGGRRKGFHAVVIDEVRVRGFPYVFTSAHETAGWLSDQRPALVAVDGPSRLAPDGLSSRPCERDFIAARICGIRFTPDLATIRARRDGFYEWIEHGLELYDALQHVGLPAIECFPTASWTRWAGQRTSSRAVWTRAALATLGLKGVPSPTNQDVRDAIAAAVTARSHSRGTTQTYGELVIPGP